MVVAAWLLLILATGARADTEGMAGVGAWLPDSRDAVQPVALRADAAQFASAVGDAPAEMRPAAGPGSGGLFVTVYTCVMWVAVPLILVAYTVLHFANERGRRTRRALGRMRRRLADSLRREERLRRTLARQQVVVNKLSSIALVDEVAGASRNGADRSHVPLPR